MEMRPIPGVIGYSATKCGRIISHHRLEPFALATARHPSGYRKVTLKVADGQYKSFLVHRLVLAAWVGPCPKGAVTNHKNGNKTDNCLENLEYCSQAENMVHAVGMGLAPKPPTRRGENAPKAKLTPDNVRAIRQEAASASTPLNQIAAKYDITTATVSKVVLRRTWRHL